VTGPPASEPRWSRAVIMGAARRFGRLVLGVTGITVLASLAIGLPSGSSLSRSLATGFYVAGCVTLVLGFALAARGPVRIGRSEAGGVRFATASERDDAISDSAIFLALGIVLLLAGVLLDTRYPLV
jgi:hypothetical protein